MWISIVIPALNEEEPIAQVVREVLATKIPREVIVVDNGSTDRTAERARKAGARVISAVRGYGRACAAGVAAVSGECDLVVFMDIQMISRSLTSRTGCFACANDGQV